MATTSSNLAAGKALAVKQGGNGNYGHYGLKAKVLAGVAILGCAATLVFGGLRGDAGTRGQAQGGAAAPPAQASGAERQRFLELNTQLPAGSLPSTAATHDRLHYPEQNLWFLGDTASAFASDPFTYREDRRAGGAAPRPDWATIRLIEQNTLPETAPVVGTGLVPPTPANFLGEDH